MFQGKKNLKKTNKCVNLEDFSFKVVQNPFSLLLKLLHFARYSEIFIAYAKDRIWPWNIMIWTHT